LIEKSKNGNHEAFERLMSDHLKIIYNYISSHISTTEDIKDIVQETMLAAWKSIKKYDGKASFRTWVIGITRRKIADYYRTLYKNTSVSLSEIEDFWAAENEFDSIVDSVAVEKSMTALGKIEKEIVFLVFNAQLSYSEISEIMHIPVGTIKSKMSNIKAKIRKQLNGGG